MKYQKISDLCGVYSFLLFLHVMKNHGSHFVTLFLLVFAGLSGTLKAQDKVVVDAADKVTFEASDHVIVTALLYKTTDTLPYIILFHDVNSSKGEFRHETKKFLKLGYNLLAVDLRNGGLCDSVPNETAVLAKLRQPNIGNAEVQLDMVAAINYVHTISKKKVILLGSGYSASLVLYIGATNPLVSAVVAYSPYDYFGGSLKTADVFPKYQSIPVYVASSQAEENDAKKYIAAIPSARVTQFAPTGSGSHGSGALLPYDADFHSYWISLLLFLKSVK